MKREQETPLFDAARELPMELSLNEVQQIITILPTLPLDQSWIHSLFTKSFIMSTLSITLISTALFLFLPSEKPMATLITEEQEPTTLAYETEEAPFPEIAQTPTELTQTEDLIENKSEMKFQDDLATSETIQDSLPESIFELTTTADKSSLRLSSDKSEDIISRNSEGTWLDKAEYNLSVSDTTPILELNGNFIMENDHSAYGDLPIGKIKRELFRKLKKDNFISSKKELVILKLMEDEILINDKILNPQQEKSYADWLGKYNIGRGPLLQIRICSNYIMIGDFDEGDYFKGRARGKNMILKFKEEHSESILDQEN